MRTVCKALHEFPLARSLSSLRWSFEGVRRLAFRRELIGFFSQFSLSKAVEGWAFWCHQQGRESAKLLQEVKFPLRFSSSAVGAKDPRQAPRDLGRVPVDHAQIGEAKQPAKRMEHFNHIASCARKKHSSQWEADQESPSGAAHFLGAHEIKSAERALRIHSFEAASYWLDRKRRNIQELNIAGRLAEKHFLAHNSTD